MTETTVVKLRKPIKGPDGADIAEITLREPNVGDMIAAEGFKGVVSSTIAMIASVTGIKIPVLNKLSPHDFHALDEALANLSGNSQGEDGETSPS